MPIETQDEITHDCLDWLESQVDYRMFTMTVDEYAAATALDSYIAISRTIDIATANSTKNLEYATALDSLPNQYN